MAVSQGGEQTDADAAVADAEETTSAVRPLDFSLPTKFTPEIRRRVGASLEAAYASMSSSLSIELKAEVELEIAETAQHTWAGARAGLPADSVAVAVNDAAAGSQLMLSMELPLILQALECMLGGEAERAPESRHLTDLDWALARGAIDVIVRDLSGAWEELGGGELRAGEVDVEGDAGLLVAPGEPTLAVAVRGRIDGASSGMSLLLPWASVAHLAEGLRGAGAPAPGPRAEREAEELRRGLASAQVLVRAEVGSAQMPIERMLELVPDTVLELSDRAEDGVRLFAEEVSLGRGKPGRSGTHRAVKVEITGEPAVRAETYAKLGRAELERARAWAQSRTDASQPAEAPEILRSIFVRVWAELGRTHMSLAGALELAQGAVVELDQLAHTPVELFANGLCFANGSLVVTTEGSWGVRVAELL